MSDVVRVIHEDNHLIVADKPAGMATMGARADARSLHRWLCDDIRVRHGKPGKVFLGVVSRLDRDTTGVIVMARTSKSAARLAPQFGAHTRHDADPRWPPAEKIYEAILSIDSRRSPGRLCPGHTELWIDAVRKNEPRRRMETADRSTTQPIVGVNNDLEPTEDILGVLDQHLRRRDAKSQIAAALTRVLAADDRYVHIRVRLLTGRKHQIRVQSAARDLPVLGDPIYLPAGHRPARRSDPTMALHCRRVTITHPTIRDRRDFAAPPPRSWDRVLESI